VELLKHLKFKADGFAVMEGHTSIWGEPQPHRAVFQEGYGLQVERGQFDQILLDQAGVKVHFGRSATNIIRENGKVAGVSSAQGDQRAVFIVMATGPGNTVRHLRQSAIFGYWKNSKHPEGSQANDTIIESFPNGWVWSLRLASDLRNVTVLFDQPGTSYRETIQQTSFVARMLEGAELASRPTGCDASWQCVDTFAEPGLLLVGDAGSVIDPLASQGVYKAMTSAMSAAIVINTCLNKPELETVALDFYNEEERRTYDGYAAGSIETFRTEQRWPGQPFWKTRHELKLKDMQPFLFSTQLATAIETGRANDIRFRNIAGVSVAQRPAISGAFIELNDYVVSPRFQYGYRGANATSILHIHKALEAAPQTINQLLAANRQANVYGYLRILAYMYKEGLIESL
jgi:2-polyprenyl-6-methoxyphenol hydroxylase-like FAD-dependent oxidoreductase